ncbi:uncharacterized protein LOC115622832 [Scaptodrosophila lebanonensis]|uniref:Uncharacterized protein LOC115622832 n=1 Tax=Drosophila lebanonensis TaxID=7225 RepID=A0A6J2T761_DROLE|nr:uncharacterized protein LOC115622832 [Scaptodrosophila lebanonensis]
MYGITTTIKHFEALKLAALWAGWLSVFQSLIWIGLTLVGILAYNCIVPVTDFLSYGTLIKTVWFDMYFHGHCQMSVGDYQQYDRSFLNSVETVLDPDQVLIWVCVYLGFAVCWLLSSVVLLTYLNKENVKQTLGVIYTWIFFMASICAMDVALGVIFGVDYSEYAKKALDYNFNSINAGEIYPNAAQLVAATVASISMMIISFKGFVLWIINLKLLVWMAVQAYRIVSDKDRSDTLFMPRKDSDDILATRPPIRAYEEEKVVVQAFSNPGFAPDSPSMAETIEVNEEAILRAARMSNDANLLDRRFRSLDAFQQYPPANPQSNPTSRPQNQDTVVVATAGFPVPDYSPQPHSNGIMRNNQY